MGGVKQKSLVIVESPTKAKTLNRYLGKKYVVKSSMGHLIDLPKSRIAVDVENNFKPEYKIVHGKSKILKEIKKAANKADVIFLAADPDREGEAICYHIANALEGQNGSLKRIVFHEITKPAILESIGNPTEIDLNKVNAQQARRILDRLVGYNLSPLLWKKVKSGLSAGRVQSVALKVICDREDEIDAFVPQEYWTIDALFAYDGKKLKAKLSKWQGEKPEITNEDDADKIVVYIRDREFAVTKKDVREKKRNPQPPYITSKLQQDAVNRYGFPASKTMFIAQQLYEGVDIKGEGSTGLITYMRTDSVKISSAAMESVRSFINDEYGDAYLPPEPNIYKSKKFAQEAHEAIRPTDIRKTPESIADDLSKDQYKIYRLIWEKFVSSQMEAAVLLNTTLNIESGDALFTATGITVKFNGFLKLYRNSVKEEILPEIDEGEKLNIEEIDPVQHFTEPPPRFTDASLIKKLEESGVGRPSTYAPTIRTLTSRYYVLRRQKQLVPTEIGRLTNGLLKKHFPDLLDINFTAKLEDDLDKIETENLNWHELIKEFYFPFKKLIDSAYETMEKYDINKGEEVGIDCEKCGMPLVKKLGRYGYFLACSGFPKCRNTKPIPLGKCPKEDCDGEIVKKRGKKGRVFFGCSNYPECEFATWNNIIEKKCPKCGNVMEEKSSKGQKNAICLNENCQYTEEL